MVAISDGQAFPLHSHYLLIKSNMYNNEVLLTCHEIKFCRYVADEILNGIMIFLHAGSVQVLS